MMPHITMFTYSELFQLQNLPEGKGQRLNIINPILVIIPEFLPTTYSFSVTFGILGVKMEVPHELKITFWGPDEEVIFDSGNLNIQFPIPENKKGLPEDMRGPVISMDIRNAALEEEGEYFTKIFLDGEEMGKYPIKIKKAV